jgi:amino acid adenylation domain-containing protein
MNSLSKHTGKLPPEQAAVRAKCFHPSGTFTEFQNKEVEQSIPARFEKIVTLHPKRTAVKTGEQKLTYDVLNKAANRIASSIYQVRGAEVEPVALISQHISNIIASCLGILKAGKILVVVDPSFPFERQSYMIENSQAGAIVTDGNSLALANALAKNERRVIAIDALGGDLSEANLGLEISPDAPAQIVYSSGSTGQPKGIFFNHRRILHSLIADINTAHICPDDRIVEFRKLSFSAAMRVLFKALLTGASFFPYDISGAGLSNLANFLITEGITIFLPGVSIFRHFVAQLRGTEIFPSIRILQLGGDAIFPSDVEHYRKFFPEDCLLLHHLSCSEAGVVCQYFLDKSTQVKTPTVPVGYPVEGKEIFLVDDSGRQVEPGEIGEIAVRSRYLSSGYWRDSVLTKTRYLADPAGGDERLCLTGDLGRVLPDGCLIHTGRKDFVVKIRGYRVELGEVESALLSHPNVRDGGVVAWDREAGEKYLVGYIVPRTNPDPRIDELRGFLKDKLPDYMIPSTFIFLDALPLTNGKLDRKALPKPDGKRPELSLPYTPPQSEVERKLAQIWAEVLSLDRVGIHDNFFDLGGHSLAATQVVSRVIKKFQLEIPIQSLFHSPTVADMADLITANQAKQLGGKDLDRILVELESLSEDEAQRLLADQVRAEDKKD